MQIPCHRGLVPALGKTWAVGLMLAAGVAVAATAPGYDRPPPFILDVLHASAPPTPYVSPTRASMLLVSWREYPPMVRVATPILKLAGSRVEIANHSKHDTAGGYGITPCATSFDLVDAAGGRDENGPVAGRRAARAGPTGRPTASASRSPTRRGTRSSCGSATPRPARSARSRASGSTRCSTVRCSGCPITRRCSSRPCPTASARHRRNRSWRPGRASRKRAAAPARAARTRRATRSRTRTTRTCSTTTPRRRSRSSTRRRSRSRASASRPTSRWSSPHRTAGTCSWRRSTSRIRT